MRASSKDYFLGLDGLRGLAVLAVLGYHFGASFLTGGYLGVDVFFVISGFVVTRNLVRLGSQDGGLRQFIGRRFSRLYPVLIALLVAIAAFWALDGNGVSGRQTSAMVGASLMSFNVAAVYGRASTVDMLHLWSLSVEWHFYLLALVLVLAWRSRVSDRRRVVALVALAGALAGVRLGLLLTDTFSSFSIYLSTLTRLDGLLLGTAIALAPATWLGRRWMARLAAPALLALVVLVVVGPAWGDRPPVTLGLIVPVAGLATAAFVANEAARSVPSWIHRGLHSKVLVWSGQRSYSLYVWHYFIGVSLIGNRSERWQGWLIFGAQVIASLIAAEASYRLMERPARIAINSRLAPKTINSSI